MDCEKFVVPAGAYVRNADYYWSFNEWADSGNDEIFLNTGEYSFGLFNGSASFIEQRNDSINNASTWYTLKFDKNEAKCVQISGLGGENHTCLVDPKTCTDGFSMEVWVRYELEDFNSEDLQVIVSSDGGHGGFYVYSTGRKLGVLIANGTHYWSVLQKLPNTIEPGDWFNVAFRWKTELGVMVFINGILLEEIPFSKSKDLAAPQLPSDNKLYVGCRKQGIEGFKDFLNVELDELAFWISYIADEELEWFTGAIIEAPPSPVFLYQSDIIELLPPSLEYLNPYYRIADIYEPCDNVGGMDFGAARINTTRGHMSGVELKSLPGGGEIIAGTASTGVGDLDSADAGLSVSFWVHLNISDTDSFTIIEGSNWNVAVQNGEFVITARYTYTLVTNATLQDTYIQEEVISTPARLEGWTNFAFSWHKVYMLNVTINGLLIEDSTPSEPIVKDAQVGDPDSIRLKHTPEEVIVSDIVIWKRYLFDFETYRFLGMTASEAFLIREADYYWTTDYFVTSDQKALGAWRPLYKTVNSTIAASDSGIDGRENKGQAMEIIEESGWAMLGLNDNQGAYTQETGQDFAGTCLSDPSLCGEGVTFALWLRLSALPEDNQRYTIVSSGEEDVHSRGFSIYIQDQELHTALVDGIRYWRISLPVEKFRVDTWMHYTFTWSSNPDDGLWVFINGEVMGINKEGTSLYRPTDRFSRITLGRNNANNVFQNFLHFAFQEIAVYLKFTVSYGVREKFALRDNIFYLTADHYWNRDCLISSKLSYLNESKETGVYVGPVGTVLAFNNTVSLVEDSYIKLGYLPTTQCMIDPDECTNGVTVSTWARTNMFTEDDIVPLLSSHDDPLAVIDGTKRGWVIFYHGITWNITVVNGHTMWNASLSDLARPLGEGRWTNLGFSWSAGAGVTIFMDGQVAGLMRKGHPATPSAPTGAKQSVVVGYSGSGETTFIDIYNVAVWEKTYISSRGYELTGHYEEQIKKYSKVNLMWTFDGPIHQINTKYNELDYSIETYDDTDRGAAIHVTRDGLNAASLGDYSNECVTSPSTCVKGFQLGMKMKLTDYIPGRAPDNVGSILLLGSPDANFEGIALQQMKVDEENIMQILIANDTFLWSRNISLQEHLDVWFDVVIAWSKEDLEGVDRGIEFKLNNKKIGGKGKKRRTDTARLQLNKLTLGIGSGGGNAQGIDASFNDITITYNSKVAVEQEGRCYDTAIAYYRLDKGQIYSMEEVSYVYDRAGLPNSAYYVTAGYTELDAFPDHCFSDPSMCPVGFTMSVYIRVKNINQNEDNTLVSSGYPHTRGVRLTATEVNGDPNSVYATVKVNNGEKTWTVRCNFTKNSWINLGFAWNNTEMGLGVYIEGISVGNDTSGAVEAKGAKDPERNTIVVGRGNGASDVDFSNSYFDDFALWDSDIRSTERVELKIPGIDCGGDSLQVIAEEPEPEITEPVGNLTVVTEVPPGCVYYVKETELCATSAEEFNELVRNDTDSGHTITHDMMRRPLAQASEQTSGFTENSTDKNPTKLKEFVEILHEVARTEMAQDVPQDIVEDSLQSAAEIVSNLTQVVTWKNDWDALHTNDSGAAQVLKDVDDLVQMYCGSMKLGLDLKDDCSPCKAGSDNVLMSAKKIRLKLCFEPYILPDYEDLYRDPKTNASLAALGHPTDTIELPPDIFDYEIRNSPDDVTATVAVVVYDTMQDILPDVIDENSFLAMEGTTSADDLTKVDNSKFVVEVNSRVVSMTVTPPIPPPIKGCVKISLEHLEPKKGDQSTYCAYWDYTVPNTKGGGWSTVGCEISSTNVTHTICCCNHLTSFAILMQPVEVVVEDKSAELLSYITYAGLGLSLLSLTLFFLIVLCNKSLRSERNLVHLNLCIAMICANVSFLLIDFAKDTPMFCKGIAISMHFFYTSSFCWMFIESLSLFYAVLYGELFGRMKCYAPFAWITPAVIVGITAGLYWDSYGVNDRCWLSYKDFLVMAFIGPVLFFILLNAIVLLIVICNLPQPTLKRKDILSEVRSAVKFTILLIPALGFTWTLGLLTVTKSVALNTAFQYIYVILNSLQGFFVFLVYGLGQRSIRMAIMRKKYQPDVSSANGSKVLLTGSTSSNESLREPAFVPVKPQPLSRPSSKKKERSSPRPADQEGVGFSSAGKAQNANRRESSIPTATEYIP